MANGTTTQQPNPAQLANLFLQYARDDFSAIQNGSLAQGSAGGASAGKMTWDNPVQDYAAWAYEISVQVRLPIALTLAAGASCYLSPWAPFSSMLNQLLIGGAESIPPVSAVPFWLDELTWGRDVDTADYGPASQNVQSSTLLTAGLPNYTTAQQQLAFGVWEWDNTDVTTGPVYAPYNVTSTGYLVPGQKINNAGTAAVTNNYLFVFKYRMLLGRKMYGRMMEDISGCIPLGDPSSRPLLNLSVNSLVGNQPENNMFVNAAGGAVSAVTGFAGNTTATANVQWVAKTLDQLPQALAGKIPPPKVLMALEVDTNQGYAVPNAGQYIKLQVRTSMIYHKTFYCLVNAQMPVTPDYFSFWYSDNRQNAREEFDSTQNTMQELSVRYHKSYSRFLPWGTEVHDFVGGRLPETPKETPYRGLITPSTSLASMAGLKPYPAAQGVLRIPTGTVINQAYCTTYSFGMVPVAY